MSIKWDKRSVIKAFEEAMTEQTAQPNSLGGRLKELANIRKTEGVTPTIPAPPSPRMLP